MKKYDNFASALATLSLSSDQDLTNEFVQGGIIAKFSLQFELSWKLLKALPAYEGEATAKTGSPRDILKAAFHCYDWLDEATWLGMLRDRNDTAHIYNAELVEPLVRTIIESYTPHLSA